MKLKEALLFAVVLLAVSVCFARATRIRYFTQALDEAYFRESIDTTYSSGKSQTFLTASVVDALQSVIYQPAAEVCQGDLAHPRLESVSIYERHAFPVLYPLALLRRFTGSLNILVLCAVIAFPGLLAIVYALARRFRCPRWLGVVLVTLTAAHPAWSYSAFGQFYPDKLFPFFGLIYLGVLYEYLSGKRASPWMLLISGVVAASTSERSAIMLAAATGAALAWHSVRRGLRRADLAPLLLTIALILYLFGYMHYVQVNSDYAAFGDSAADFVKSAVTGLSTDSRKFLAINTGLLFPFALAGGMWTAVAAGSLLPNLIGTIGGAEKLGWFTHYHSAYLPFLLFSILAGAALLFRRSPGLARICGALALAQAAIFLMLNPLTSQPLLDLSPSNLRQSALVQMVEFQTGTGPPAGHIARASFFQSVASLIPEGSEVSTTEFYMPALYDHGVHTIHFYPLGVGRSRFVVVPYAKLESGKLVYRGHISYLGPEVAEETNQCLTNRLNSAYRVAHMIEEFAGAGTAILELK